MELVNQVCRGDREAYWRLVEPHTRTVLRIATAILKDLSEAEEVPQEAILRALSKIHDEHGRHGFRLHEAARRWTSRQFLFGKFA